MYCLTTGSFSQFNGLQQISFQLFKFSKNKHLNYSRGVSLVELFFCIRPPPELLPVLGLLEQYMTPTLEAALLM